MLRPIFCLQTQIERQTPERRSGTVMHFDQFA